MSKGLMGNPTDVAPAVQAVKNTGGRAQGEADMAMTMRKERKAAGTVSATMNSNNSGRSAAKKAGEHMVPGVMPGSQPHKQGWGK